MENLSGIIVSQEKTATKGSGILFTTGTPNTGSFHVKTVFRFLRNARHLLREKMSHFF